MRKSAKSLLSAAAALPLAVGMTATAAQAGKYDPVEKPKSAIIKVKCNPCAAKKGKCSPRGSSKCAAKKCNPCAAKKGKCSPRGSNPCAAKKGKCSPRGSE